MKYKIAATKQFKKTLKNAILRGLEESLLNDIIRKLANDEKLPDRCRDHQLKGNLKDFRECHIAPDWLLKYKKIKDKLILILAETGTHSDMFK
jgi:mRNA interferase YafQ